jgi:hypothetical protein
MNKHMATLSRISLPTTLSVSITMMDETIHHAHSLLRHPIQSAKQRN